jgi:hypothetical protein
MRRDSTAANLLRLWAAVCAEHAAHVRGDEAASRAISAAAESGRAALALIAAGWTIALLVYLATR